jgi:hypothetical protein
MRVRVSFWMNVYSTKLMLAAIVSQKKMESKYISNGLFRFFSKTILIAIVHQDNKLVILLSS